MKKDDLTKTLLKNKELLEKLGEQTPQVKKSASLAGDEFVKDEVVEFSVAETTNPSPLDSESVLSNAELPDMYMVEAQAELGVVGDPSAEEEPLEEEKEEAVPENLEFVQVRSVIESLMLASDKPINMATFKEVFRGTNTSTDTIRRAVNDLMVEYAGAERGMQLNEVSGGYQLRTKSENMVFVRRLVKGRAFRLSGPALEVLAIVAYKQPLIKNEVDQIRGVESGHLLRGLMDRGIVRFVGKSDLPGKPMLYGTTRKFLEIFGLRDVRELPSLSEIDELLPDGIGDEEAKPEREWSNIHEMSMQIDTSREQAQEIEWQKLTEQISQIETTTQFFEEERKREKLAQDTERANRLKQDMENGFELNEREKKWLARFEASQAATSAPEVAEAPVAESVSTENIDTEPKA